VPRPAIVPSAVHDHGGSGSGAAGGSLRVPAVPVISAAECPVDAGGRV